MEKATINKEGLKKLREPFPPEAINTLPKPYKKDSPKGKCNVCGGYHGLPAAHLDYVGHAALTDRLLEADPLWTWEPLAYTENGTPLIDGQGGMWIKLTVCGVTRLGYGDSGGKRGTNATKELIGDALRNAGMRFGCALELWHKGDLPHQIEDDEAKNIPPQQELQNKQLPKGSSDILERAIDRLDEFAAPGRSLDELIEAWPTLDAHGKKILSPEEYKKFVAYKNDVESLLMEQI